MSAPLTRGFTRCCIGWKKLPETAQVSAVIDEAQKLAAYGGTPRAKVDKKAILWRWGKLDPWGCYGEEGMAELRKGRSPTIKNGFLAGEEMALDHVLPVALVPELRSAFFNLEAVTAKENTRKGAEVGEREKNFALVLFKDGLLSREGLEIVEKSGKP